MRRPTISDLARASGVSVATVDRVLNGRHRVREETARRVYDAAQSIGYHAVGLIRQRVFEDLRFMARSHDNFDLFWWPFCDDLWVKTWKPIRNTSINARPRYSRSDKWISDIGSRVHNGLIRLTERYPRLTPPISRRDARGRGGRPSLRVSGPDRSG